VNVAKKQAESKKGRLIIKAISVSKASIDADVRETVGNVTGITNSTFVISSKYVKAGAWLADADKIEKRLVVVHGYAAFRLNDKEAGSFYSKSFNAFMIFCRDKILGGAPI
jgi:hypothetical protein